MARPERRAPFAPSGERVELRPATVADGGTATIVRRQDGAAVGALAYRLAGGWLVVQAVALEPAERGRGYGSEAVRLLEDEAAKRGTLRFGFAVPKEDGLALYFALRLGYRPAAAGEPLWRRASGGDIIAMVRTPGARD
jgi:GNAT superfamily N-acetyltransferase